MLMKTLVAMALGGLATWHLTKQTRLDRERRAAGHKPRDENTWENEGGALHGTGAQLGPDPALP